MRRARFFRAALASVAMVSLAACTGGPTVRTGAAPTSSDDASTGTSVASCPMAQLHTVTNQLGALPENFDYVITVKNIGVTTCELSNDVTLSGHPLTVTGSPAASPPTVLSLAGPSAVSLPATVAAQSKLLALSPGQEATLTILAPRTCPNLTGSYEYAEVVMDFPTLGSFALQPDEGLPDCGPGSLVVQPWRAGVVPDLSPASPQRSLRPQPN
jgi:hypothetical protein